MNTTRIWLLALVGVFGAGDVDACADPLKAGAAAVEITPRQFPINVRGRIRHRVHSPLHSRALVFADGTTTLALVVVDNLGVAEESCDDARRIASERCGIRPDHVMIASTHTHSAPGSNSTMNGP